MGKGKPGKCVFQKAAAMLLAVLLLNVALPASSAQEQELFSFTLSSEEGRPDEVLSLSLHYGGEPGKVGAFLAQVEYDPQCLEFQRASESSGLRSGYTLTYPQDGVICFGYVKGDEEEKILQPGELFTWRFRVSEAAPEGEMRLATLVSEITAPDLFRLEDLESTLSFTVLPPPSSDSSLVSLKPENGVLEPEFSPDCHDYTLTVPFSVTVMSFLAEPAEGAACRVNRKNLGAGGSDTEFLLTVTAEDGKTKSVYKVTVHREEKPAAAGTASHSGAASGTKEPSKTAQKNTDSEKPAETPEPAPERTGVEGSQTAVNVPAQAKAERTEVYPTVVVRNGDSAALPMFLSVLIIAISVLVSGPLSRWICARIPARPKVEESGEEGSVKEEDDPGPQGE